MPRPSRRNKILASAASLFARRGFESVSTRDIANEVGISSPSIYHHFANKEALILAVLAAMNERRSQAYMEIIRSEEPDTVKLKTVFSYLMVGYAGDVNTLRVFLHTLLSEDDALIETFIHGIYADAHLEIANTISRVAPDQDPYFTMYTMMSLTIGYIHFQPMQNKLRRLTSGERDPLFLAQAVLSAGIPHIEWAKVPYSESFKRWQKEEAKKGDLARS